MASRNLLVKILGDDRDLQRAFASSSRGATQFGTSVERSGKKADTALRNIRGLALGTGAGFAGGLAAGEVLRQANAAISVASNLNEQISRNKVVFEGSAAAVEAWSKTTAESIGIAQDEALAAAGTFGAMFAQAGQGSADAARLSESVVTLASDLASFNNASIEDTLTALRSGLSGEIEPLRRFQVFLTEATVSQRALADSGKTSVEQLTQGEKILARYNLILEQTGKQQGDFTRTSDSLANQQRILSARTRDLQADIGSALLPAMESLTAVLIEATELASGLADALGAIGSIEIPTIEIPFTTKEVGGGTVGRTVAKGAGIGALGLVSPAALIAVAVKKAIDEIRGEAAGDKDIAGLAQAFDDQFAKFTQNAFTAANKSVDKANAKLKQFGETGWKPLKTNELAETLQRQFDAAMDALSLDFDQARVTAGAADELRVLDQQEAAVRARIASQGRTTALERQLFQIQQDRARVLEDLADQRKQAADDAVDRAKKAAEAQRRAREQAAAERQEDQFRALGLTAEGGRRAPTVSNLRKQLAQLTERLVDEGEMTPKIRAQLKKITNVLKGETGKVTEESRETIRDMFGDIRQVFDDESGKDLPDIRAVTLSDKMLAALGFGPEADVAAKLGADKRRFSAARGGNNLAAPPPQVFTGPITVVADDPDAFLRQMQKKANRTTATSRGRFPGKSMGLA